MTVILLVATLAILIAVDYLFGKRLASRTAAEPEPEAVPSLSNVVGGFRVRENLRYHPGHTWALQESPDLVRVGMDDFAARLIGTPEEIELPKFGQWIRQGQRLCTVRRDGGKAELLSPIEGIVADVNLGVVEAPDLATREPYTDGWLITVQAPDIKTSFRNLLGGTMALKWMEDAAGRLRARLPALAGAAAQDGGVVVADVTRELPGEIWTDLTREFFLS